MADIARLAGVSISTVSRALAGSELVNAETRERVRALAASLNYTVNLGAQNLRKQRNRTIAVVIPYDRVSRQHISDPFFLSMVGALADALTDSGFDMLLSRVDSESLDDAAKLVDSGVAIGIVLIGQWRHHDQLNALAARDVPIVVWGAQLPEQLYCTVGGDNHLGGLLAIAAIQALREARLAVPTDVSVVGYDDITLAGYFDPPLTTVHQPVGQAGAELVDALLALIDGQAVVPRLVPVRLVERRSSLG